LGVPGVLRVALARNVQGPPGKPRERWRERERERERERGREESEREERAREERAREERAREERARAERTREERTREERTREERTREEKGFPSSQRRGRVGMIGQASCYQPGCCLLFVEPSGYEKPRTDGHCRWHR